MPSIDDLIKNGVNYYSSYEPEKKPEDGNFVRGVKRAMVQIPETLGGTAALVGDIAGVDGLRDYGLKVYEANKAKEEALTKESDSLTNVLQGDASAADWAAGSAGYVAGQAATAVVTGGVGGFIGSQLAKRGIAEVVKRGAESAIAKQVAGKVAAKGAQIGAGVALGASNLSQEAGSIYPEALDQANKEGRTLTGEDKARIVGSAVAAAGVDTAMDAVMAGRILHGGRRAMTDSTGAVLRDTLGNPIYEGLGKTAAREITGGMAREGVTEGIQTGIERFGAGQDLSTADAIRDYVDSIGVGALGGGLGGAAGSIHKQKVPESGPLTRAANTAIDAENAQNPLLLTNEPDPIIVFPDGSAGHRADFENYLNSMPEEKRPAVRARLLGLSPQELTEEDKKELNEREQSRIARDNIAILSKREPYTLEQAYRATQTPAGKKLMIVPHASGAGYVLAKPEMLTIDHQIAALDLMDEAQKREDKHQEEQKVREERAKLKEHKPEGSYQAVDAIAQDYENARRQATSEYLNKEALRRESELQNVDANVAVSDMQRRKQARFSILDNVLANEDVKGIDNKQAHYLAELKRAGYVNPSILQEEQAHIERHDAIASAFENDQIPSAPNEMDVAALVREKKEKGPAGEQKTFKPTETVFNPKGEPFKTEMAARRAIKTFGLAKTHEVKPAEGGFVLQPAAAPQAKEQAAKVAPDVYADRSDANAAMLAAAEKTGQVHEVIENGNGTFSVQPAAQQSIEEAAHEAATSPKNELPEPSAGQTNAGNYKLGHGKINGLDISFENPAGSVRKDKANNPPKWQTEMKDHYGYFKGVAARASDKDHVDVFVKPGTPSDYSGPAFIVDQNHANGKFDEPKVILGANSLEDAKETYLRNYDHGWDSRIRGITQVSMDELKARLQDEKAFTKPQSDSIGVSSTTKAKHGTETSKENPVREARNEGKSGIHDLAEDKEALPRSGARGLSGIRGEGDNGMPGMADQLSGVSSGHGAATNAESLTGQDQGGQGIQSGKLPMGDKGGAVAEPSGVRASDRAQRKEADDSGVGARNGNARPNAISEAQAGAPAGGNTEAGRGGKKESDQDHGARKDANRSGMVEGNRHQGKDNKGAAKDGMGAGESRESVEKPKAKALQEREKKIKEKQGAQHIEQGQAEPATAAVIAQSIKKSADRTPMNYKEAKAALLADIDKAIQHIKDIYPTYDGKGKNPTEDFAQFKKDSAAWDKANPEKLTFDVAGDGKFTVLNKIENLENFRKKVAANKGFEQNYGKKGFSGRPFAIGETTSTTIKEMMEGGEQVAAYELAKASGTPFRFAPHREAGKLPILFTDAKDIDDMPHGIKGFVGKIWGQKGASWTFTEAKTGQRIGDVESSAAEAVRKAKAKINGVKPEALQNLLHGIEQQPKVDFDALEAQWLEAAEKADQDFADKEAAKSDVAAKAREAEQAAAAAKEEEEAKKAAERASSPEGRLEAAGFKIRNGDLTKLNSVEVTYPGSQKVGQISVYNRQGGLYQAYIGTGHSRPGIELGQAIEWLKNWYAEEAKANEKKAPALKARDQKIAEKAAETAEDTRKPWEKTLAEYTADKLAKSQYREAIEEDADARKMFNDNAERDWTGWISAQAKLGRIPDNVLDDMVARKGIEFVQSVFRGVNEKGAEGYLPPDVRGEKEKAPALQARDSFTVERGTENNTLETVTFNRGEYVKAFLSKDKWSYGELEGISHAKREAKVKGVWYSFGSIYKAEKPAEVKPETVPMSSVVDAVNAKHGADVTEADRIMTAERHTQVMEAARNGSISLDDFKTAYANILKNEAGIKEELNAKTKPELLKAGGFYFADRYKNDKKADVIEALYNDMVREYAINGTGTISYGMSSGFSGYRNALNAATAKAVDALTDADLKAYADSIKKAREERAAVMAERAKGMENPQTLEDYQNLLRAKMAESEGKTFREAFAAITPEQRAKYDELAGAASRDKRKSQKEERLEQTMRAPGEALTATETIQTKHTKHGHDLWQFNLNQRVSSEEFKDLVAKARKLGGDYSSYRGNGAVPGWQFRTPEGAAAFKKLISGDASEANEVAKARRDAFADDKSQTAAERLKEMADSLEESGNESLNADRKSNTARRARHAAAAESAARSMIAMAKTMRNIAAGIENGTAKFLDKVRAKTQIALLASTLDTAHYNAMKAKHGANFNSEKYLASKAAIPADSASFAEWPSYSLYRSDLASLGRRLMEVDGTKKLGQQILKVADDVTDAYLKFAKENLFKVGTFYKKDGERAAFPSKAMAEEAISRSNYRGQAIVLQVKRGENVIILSPSEAQKRGIWTGDDDKRITLSSEIGAEIVEKLGRINRRSNKIDVPWQFESAHDKLGMWKRMGIETPAEMRAALREYVNLREAPDEADKIKELERAMVGRRNDGMDFFPTPADQADAMVETAGLEPGMSVLEPSAGMGHIADRIRASGFEPDVVELSGDRRELLEAKGYNLVGDDFMQMNPRGYTYGDVFKHKDGRLGILGSNGGLGSSRYKFIPLDGDGRNFDWVDREDLTGHEKRGTNSGYDRIIMNPPFSDRRDVEHVQHAYDLLKPGGRLVAIMGEGSFFGQDKKAQQFREWLEKVGGTDEKLAEGTFMDPSLPVNTGVNARMVVIDKPAAVEIGDEKLRAAVMKNSKITIDGKERHTTNSEGKPIAYTTAGLRDFWNWYGESETDESGHPIVKETEQGKVYVNDQAQVKSVDNIGTWNPKDPRINYAKGDIQAPGALDADLAHMIRQGKGVNDILTRIERQSSNPDYRDLAAKLRALGLKTKLQFSERNGRNFTVQRDQAEFAAGYAAGTDTAHFFTDADTETHIMHELVHAATVGALEKGGLASTQMKALYKYVSNLGRLKGRYGMENVEEFVAEAFSNPQFRAELSDIPAPGVGKLSLWQKFMGFVRILLGKPAISDNVLERVLSAGQNLMEENRTAGAAGEALHGNIGKTADSFMESLGASDNMRNKVADLFQSEKTFNHWWHKTVGTQYHKAQIDHHFKRVYDATQRYLSTVSLLANEAADAAPTLLPKLEGLRDLTKKPPSKADTSAAAKAIFQGTLSDGKVYSDGELREKFGLNDKQIGMYREFRAAVDKSLDDMGKTDILRYAGKDGKAFTDAVMGAKDVNAGAELMAQHFDQVGDEDMAAEIRAKAEKISALKAEGYAPLMRFGEYTVYVTDAKGDQLFFGMAETEREAAALARDMKEIYPEATVTKGVLSKEGAKLFSGISPDTIEVFAQAAGIDKNPLFQDYLKLVVNNRSALKRLIHRKGVAGFSQDATRVLASFLTSNARAASKNLHAGEMTQAANEIPKEKGDVRDEAIKLVDYIQNPVEEAVGIRGLLFTNFIGGSIASAAVNMTQPVMMTLPYLSQFGGAAKATKTLLGAMKAAVAGDGAITDKKLRDALHQAEREGIVSPQEIHNLQAEAMRSSKGFMIGGKEIVPAFAARKFAVVWGGFFGLAEQFNRKATFIAAYQMAQDMTPAQFEQAGVNNAYEFAAKSIAETQGVYNRGNRPDWARGAAGATLMTFKQYSIAYLEFLKRLPAKERALALAILAVAAGANGLPFADDLDDVIDTIGQALGYNFNIKKSKERFLTQTIGKGAAEFVLHGFSGVGGMPLDVSMRMGMGNLLPATGLFKQSNTQKGDDYAEILGAAGGFMQKLQKSGEALTKGDALGALMAVQSTAVQNVVKAVDMMEHDAYRDTKGRKVIATDAVDALIKGIGFQPGNVAHEQQRLGMVRQDVDMANAVKARIADQWAQAVFDRDPEAASKAREAINAWNAKNPDSRINVNAAQIATRVREMRMEKADRVIKHAPKSMRESVREEIKS